MLPLVMVSPSALTMVLFFVSMCVDFALLFILVETSECITEIRSNPHVICVMRLYVSKSDKKNADTIYGQTFCYTKRSILFFI